MPPTAATVSKPTEVIVLDDDDDEDNFRRSTRSQSVASGKASSAESAASKAEPTQTVSSRTPAKSVSRTTMASPFHPFSYHCQPDAFPLSQSQPMNDVTWQALSPLTPSKWEILR